MTKVTTSGINAKVFWSNVRRLREDLDKTQTETAIAVGLNPSYYSNLERGMQKSVNPITAEKVADFLGTTVDELRKGQPPKPSVFWQNVKQRRALLDVSQAEMSVALGITTQGYTYKEAAAAEKVKKTEAAIIARKLETTVADLMGRKDEIFEKLSETAKDFLATSSGRQKLEKIAKEEDRHRKQKQQYLMMDGET